MVETPSHPLPKFLAVGVGPSACELMEILQSRQVISLPIGMIDASGQDKTLQWFESEVENAQLLFLAIDFTDVSAHELLPQIVRLAEGRGCFVLVFSTSGTIPRDISVDRQGVFLVEQATHLSLSPGDIILNAIESLSDIVFTSGVINADFGDLKRVLDSNHGHIFLSSGQGASCQGTSCQEAFRDALRCFHGAGIDLKKAKGFIFAAIVGELPGIYFFQLGVSLLLEAVTEDVEIEFGLVEYPDLGDHGMVSIFAFGIDSRPTASS